MGSRLALAAVISAAFASATFAQPGPLPAADSAKQGTDLYNAGDYAGAVAPLQRAVEMEPNNFEYRFMLAQALRQSGKCGDAMPHYKQLEASAPPERANDVKTAMAGCPSTDVKQPEAVPAPPPPPPPEPVVKSGLSRGNALMLIGSGAGIAASVCLLFAASNDADDADAAAKYDDYARLSTRSDREYIGAAVAGGVGVVLGVIAFRRINSSHESTQLSLRPRSGGGTLVLERSW